jgi:hypothetical protein
MAGYGGEVWVAGREYEKVIVLYVCGSGVVVLLVAVIANNPRVSRRASDKSAAWGRESVVRVR